MSPLKKIPIPNRPEKDRLQSSFSPVSRFLAEHQQKKFAFGFGIACLAFAILAQILTIKTFQSEERVFVLDGTNTLHIGPLEKLHSESPIFETIALVATQVIFQRSPVGLDLKELREHLFNNEVIKKLDDEIHKNLDELKAKNLHQKPEISLIKCVAEKNGIRYIHVKGNLIGSGSFEGMPIVEAYQFKLNFAVVPNPKISEQKMYPYIIADYNIKEMIPV